jgi:Fur family peroxide stress response transcriptional regulator
MLVNGARPCREVCQKNGIAVTHQRQVLNEAMHGHPGPEEVDAQVKDEGAGYLAGYYSQNIHLFVESGVFRQVSMHYGSLRVEMKMNRMTTWRAQSVEQLPIFEKRAWVVSKHGKLPGWISRVAALAYVRSASRLRAIPNEC